ncbi:MAG: hypothetical protein QF918_02740 [Pirellulaceae bacterium]|nr:hypothetical protein [Pirellulaceae bacterium]MDP6556225.1 hypothetical protein [Pirellulaceae bacterium]MDP6723100.1 hypothetical protein [Pirellulaceae bacterium]
MIEKNWLLRPWAWFLTFLACLTFAGCGGEPAVVPVAKSLPTPSASTKSPGPPARPPATKPQRLPTSTVTPLGGERPPPLTGLGDLLAGQNLDDLFNGKGAGQFGDFEVPTVDDQRVAASGIRKISSRHLDLYTDVPADPAVDELPHVFDLAVPQWCDYFDVDSKLAKTWRMAAYLINDKARFGRAGLLPSDLPPFLNGFQRGAELWLYRQPTEYYQRHLLLHEGTHGFMHWALGGAGPPWYMEGVAELLGTHSWQGGQLALNHFPESKEATPHWGRIKVIKTDTEAGQGKSIEEIMHYDTTAHLRVEPYAWCWAAAAFFDRNPAYRDAFRQMQKQTRDKTHGFSNAFQKSLSQDWVHIARQWHLFVINMEYGYDVPREAFDRKPTTSLPSAGARITVAADRGWQSSGYLLEAGRTYKIEARGRYQVGNQPKIWWCEPNGITIRYHRGVPLGILLGSIVDEDKPPGSKSVLATPDVIGMGVESPVERDGTLYLRINDSPAELSDNAGELTVRVTPVAAAP